MAKQIINTGKSQNKGDGDPLRTAFTKVNENFDELYSGTFTDTTDFTTSIIPRTDNVLNLGSSTKRWSELYVKDFIFINGVRLSGTASGDLVVGGNVVYARDIVGSVFADDSTLMMDGLTGTLYGPLIGDVTGSIFSDDSSIMVDAVGKLFIGNLVGNVTGNVTGTVSSIANHTTANLTENTNLYYTDVRADARITNAGSANWNAAFAWGNHASVGYQVAGTPHDGDITGSVFADDSTLLVDGVGGKVMLTTNTTTELTEGTNLYYTDVRADARITNAGSANWNTAFAWGNHASASYHVAGTPHDGDMTGSVFGDDSTLLVDAVNNVIPGYVSLATLKTEVAASADFAAFKTRIAAL